VRSRELNVRQVLTKVAMGEGDAGIVYKTDALTMPDKVQIIEIPSAINVVAEYPIAVLKAAPHADLARDFVKLVLSKEGEKVLTAAGFSHGRRRARKKEVTGRFLTRARARHLYGAVMVGLGGSCCSFSCCPSWPCCSTVGPIPFCAGSAAR
jgi:ABC-type Fe3+ transport system substrate-binding protein